MSRCVEFWELLRLVQEHISKNYAASLTDPDKRTQIRPYIEQFLREHALRAENTTDRELVDRLYSEMAEYSVLTPYLRSASLEEINVNAWNDIALTYVDGSIVKTKEHFHSPQHAVDIIKRLLHHSGMLIDNATPMAQGHLPNNTRITALKEPLVDPERGISASLRLLHPQQITCDDLVDSGLATEEMIRFLCVCIRYGVSLVAAGATSSGKTTLINALLNTIPDEKRVFTIESGARELSLVREQDGRIRNNVVHTLSRPSDNPAYSITQEDLVVASLRFNPDVVVVGEMRDAETYAAVEASLTGHTVVSTVHSGPADAAHTRIALLCQKRFPIEFKSSLMQAGQAFPLVVYVQKLESNERRIMDISECIVDSNMERRYRTLYQYNISKNSYTGTSCRIEGAFQKPNRMSDALRDRLTKYGAPRDVLQSFIREGAVSA